MLQDPHNYVTGISCCNCGLFTVIHGPVHCYIYGWMLCSSPQCNNWSSFQTPSVMCRKFSHPMKYLHWGWSPIVNFTAMSTCPRPLFCLFGSHNRLCSSITESKHIKAVKEPWRRSSWYHALSQMLQTLVRIDKMEALQHKFIKMRMLAGTTSSYMTQGWGLRGQLWWLLRCGDCRESHADADDENDDGGPVPGGPTGSMSDIKLAAKARKFNILLAQPLPIFYFHRAMLSPKFASACCIYPSAQISLCILSFRLHIEPSKPGLGGTGWTCGLAFIW